MPADPKAQIERINTVSAMARTSWIALLGYLAFVGVTLLGVEDADFFVPTRQTQLPLINVSIPTASFFYFAPILAAALYVYLQIILLKLWDAIADAKAPRIAGHPLGDHLNPWLVNDWALTRKGPPYVPARPLLALGNLATFLLVWAAGPLVLLGFWWRSMPAHDEWLTLLLAACLLLSLHAGVTSWRAASSWLSRPRREPSDRPWWRSPAALALVLATVAVSWLRTEGGADHFAGQIINLGERLSGLELFEDEDKQEAWIAQAGWIPKLHWFDATPDVPILGSWFTPAPSKSVWPTELTGLIDPESPWNPLVSADLANIEMVALPDGWLDWPAFSEAWCMREALELSVCDTLHASETPAPPHKMRGRSEWCRVHAIPDGPPCDQAFGDLESRFNADWRLERASAVGKLPKLDLRARDLRRLRGRGASLVGADLAGVQLQGADLSFTQLLGADLRGARLAGTNLFAADLGGADLGFAQLNGARLLLAELNGADLSGARLEGADLTGAQLVGTDLTKAQLDGTNFSGARIEEADLLWAQLVKADLSDVLLVGTDLREARLEGAVLRGARLEGVALAGADLRGSDWEGASNRASPAHSADLRGVRGLTQAQLDGMIGNTGTLLTVMPESEDPLYIWSCWETPPESFHVLMSRMAEWGYDTDVLRASFLCSPENPRRKTGTPLPLDAPYPEGHLLAGR